MSVFKKIFNLDSLLISVSLTTASALILFKTTTIVCT